MKYLLPCPACGEKHRIETSQAGQRLACRCGAAVDVPTLREMRALESLAETSPAKGVRPWDPLRGGLFALGAIVAFAGVVVAGYGWLGWSQLANVPAPTPDLTQAYAELDAATPEQLLAEWAEVRSQVLGPHRLPPHLAAWQTARIYRAVLIAGVGLALVGAALAAGTLVRRAAPPARKR